GPGNFGSYYLLHKLPEASEEIQDPHNLLLDVWATAGFWAVLALVAALGFSIWNLLSPARPSGAQSVLPHDRAPRRKRQVSRENQTAAGGDPELASGSTGWLVLASGLGLVMVQVVGQMNLFQGDLLFRWLILGTGWLGAALLGGSLWRRVTLPASACGAAVLAMVVNLMAAGGISMSAVALPLWLLLALGLNLRDDRPCGHLRVVPGRLAGIGLALNWAAIAGSFVGAILPFWRCEAALAAADEALARLPHHFERASAAYDYAKQADKSSAQPWLGDAYLQNLIWQEHGARAEDLRWKTIPVLLQKATEPPRNPAAWPIHMHCAEVARELLAKIGQQLSPREVLILQGTIVRSIRTASAYHPTNPVLHARLAEASAELSMFRDAETEAREALRLDKLLAAHPRERLANATRKRLESKVLEWTEKAAAMPPSLSPASGTAHGNTAPN
ncbi:MAG TPA: O-antigen ligase domain-containing protein, partial [Isosphaeraceae bacterium]|nr:O-antigen ligase domain-containing protein [Isosphaeraceae bacterium]